MSGILDEAYGVLRGLGIARSQCDFSQFCGRSPAYFSMVKATKRQPSIEVLTTLAVRLHELRQHLLVADSIPAARALFARACDDLEGLEDRLWTAVREHRG